MSIDKRSNVSCDIRYPWKGYLVSVHLRHGEVLWYEVQRINTVASGGVSVTVQGTRLGTVDYTPGGPIRCLL